VTAQKLRYVDLLLVRPWTVTLTRKAGVAITQSRIVRIPNPAAYIVQKMLVLPRRPPDKQAKEILYVHDTFALFSDALDTLSSEWGALKSEMVLRDRSATAG